MGIPIHHQVIQVINGLMTEKYMYDDMQPIEFLSCPHVESRYSQHFSVRTSGTRVRLKFFGQCSGGWTCGQRPSSLSLIIGIKYLKTQYFEKELKWFEVYLIMCMSDVHIVPFTLPIALILPMISY